MRKLLTKILSVIVAVTATLGLVMLPKTAVQASEAITTFGAAAGASVKYGETVEETGLRFTIEVNKEFYAGLEQPVKFGALLTTKSYASSNDVVIDAENVNIADVCYVDDVSKFDAGQSEDATEFVYYASVTYRFDDAWKEEVKALFGADADIEAYKLQALATELVCRPYYIVGEKVTYAELSDARSMVKVANGAVINGDPITDDFIAKYLSTVVESQSQVFVEADGTVIGMSTKDKEMLANADSITLDDDAGEGTSPFNGDKVEASFLEGKELGKYYYVTVFNGANGYRIKYMYVTMTIDEAEDLHVFTLKGPTEENLYNEVDGYYVVIKDIDASSLVLANHQFEPTKKIVNGEWTGEWNENPSYPGNGYSADRGFVGTFDGLGHVINNLTVKSNGLFGNLNAPTIKNIAFTNVNLTGYYLTLFAHSSSTGKDPDNSFNGRNALFEDIYISVKSITGTGRLGILVNNSFSQNGNLCNVVVEYTGFSDAEDAPIMKSLLSNARAFGTIGGNQANMANIKMFSNVYSISKAPVYFRDTKPYFGENQIAHKLNDVGYVSEVGEVLDPRVTKYLNAKGLSAATSMVATGLRVYDDYAMMAKDSQANSESLATFSNKYWTVVNGVPYWKSCYDGTVELAIEDKDGNVVAPSEIIIENNTTEYAVKLLDATHEITNLTITGEGLVQVGNKFKLENNPTSKGSIEVVVTATVSGVEITRTFTIAYSNEIEVEGKVLYSKDDKSLDFASLKKALSDVGAEIISADEIDGYIVNGETVSELALDVTITGAQANRVMDTVQSVKLAVDGKVYVLTNVYAYTKLIDEATDLDYFAYDYANTSTVPTHDGYYLVTKNIDASEYVAKGHTFASGYSYPYGTDKTGGFKGVFDGNGYTISNYTAPSCGIFGYANEVLIQNVGFKNVTLTGYYNCTLAQGIDARKTKIKNVYVEVTSTSCERVGVLSYSAVDPSATLENVVTEWILDETELDRIYTKNGIISSLSHLNWPVSSYPNHYKNCVTISQAPLGFETKNGTINSNRLIVAPNKVTVDGDTVTSTNAILTTFLTKRNYTLATTNVATGVVSYDSVADMQKDATANAEMLNTFSADYWTIANGVPYWKHKHAFDVVVTAPTCDKQGSVAHVCDCGYSYVDENKYVDALGHDYSEEVTEPTCTEQGYTTYTCITCGHSYIDNYVDALGHRYENGACTVCGSTETEGIVLYSKEDKALDLPSLKVAVESVGGSITSLDEIDGYIVNGETVSELDLDVNISNNTTANFGRDRAVDTAQQVQVIVGEATYYINVYAYTKLIDEASDLNYFILKGATEDNPYNERNGYYLVTKNIDATGLDLDAHVFMTGASYPGNGYNTDRGLTGVFDGNGYEIKGLTARSSGIFGLMNAGIVKNVAFTEVKLTGYYTTLFAKGFTRGKTTSNVLNGYEGMFKDVYVSVDSINYYESNGAIGILVQGTLPNTVRVQNVVVDYEVETYTQKKIDAGNQFLMFGSSNATMANYTTSFVDCYSISTAPVSQYASMPGFAENQVEFTLENNKVTAVGNVLDEQVNEVLTRCGKTLTIDHVLVGLRAYDNYEAMAADTANDYTSFSSDYWTIVDGVPVWNTLAN